MENALLGDSMIEKLQAEGTAAEEEKRKALGRYRNSLGRESTCHHMHYVPPQKNYNKMQ